MNHFYEDRRDEPDSSEMSPVESHEGSTRLADEPVVRASAPGRVEFIGNHTDYNGGGVLGATIDRRVEVALSERDDMTIGLESTADVPRVEVPLRNVTRQSGGYAWANYILGIVTVLREEGLAIPSGCDVSVDSKLPAGAGLSSSAALEMATALALTEAYEGDFRRKTLARLAQRAENDFVGVPCGLLDQAVVAFGGRDRLVHVNGRTQQIKTVPFPRETALWIFRTHQTHALADAHYQDRHDEARAARDRLQNLLGAGAIEHLVDVSPSQLSGVKDQLGDTLYRRARHVSTEHRRVKRAVQGLDDGAYEEVGELLFSSHESSRSDYENSTDELDFVVEQLTEVETVLGARLTGAGFGGAAMAWTREGFGQDDVAVVREAYEERFGEELDVLACQPAPGARLER